GRGRRAGRERSVPQHVRSIGTRTHEPGSFSRAPLASRGRAPGTTRHPQPTPPRHSLAVRRDVRTRRSGDHPLAPATRARGRSARSRGGARGAQMILERLDVAPAELERRTGWTIRPEGACRAGECVPLDAPFDVRELAQRLGMALVEDTQHGLWALGPESGGHALASAELPDIALPDRHGRSFALRSLLGTKVLMITWASWCGCRSDLPGWRKLREELNPGGLEVVSVALDTRGEDAAGPWIDKARSTHPALIDEGHLLDEQLGVVNVPSGVWIDEHGIIVRPPEPAFPWWPRQPSAERLAELPALTADQLPEAQRIRIDPERYVAALRAWV